MNNLRVRKVFLKCCLLVLFGAAQNLLSVNEDPIAVQSYAIPLTDATSHHAADLASQGLIYRMGDYMAGRSPRCLFDNNFGQEGGKQLCGASTVTALDLANAGVNLSGASTYTPSVAVTTINLFGSGGPTVGPTTTTPTFSTAGLTAPTSNFCDKHRSTQTTVSRINTNSFLSNAPAVYKSITLRCSRINCSPLPVGSKAASGGCHPV